MPKIRVEKDNVLLTIEQEDLDQYEARGYTKVGATKKVAPEELKKLTKNVEELTKANEKLVADNEELTKANEKLIADNEELTRKIEESKKAQVGINGEKKEENTKTEK